MKSLPVGSRDSYLHLWREFVFHSRHNVVTRRRVAFAKEDSSWNSDAMNVATVHPASVSPSESASTTRGDIRSLKKRARSILGIDDITNVDFLIAVVGELIGTFFLIFMGCSACVTWNLEQPPNNIHIALTFGLAVTALAHVLGPISGCHVNPAVTFGMLVSGNCSALRSLSYVVSQCCGAIAGAAFLKLLVPVDTIGSGMGLTNLGKDITIPQGLVMETMMTFLLVLVVHAVTDTRRTDARGWAPLAIGLTITVAHLAAISVTGSSLNPARTLGPAVVLGSWDNSWIYWVGPIVGSLLGAGIYRAGFRPKSKEEDEASYDF